MVIYKSLNKSPQIIRSKTINNKNLQNDHYAMILIFQKIRTSGGGGFENQDICGQGGGGREKWQKFADALYKWPLTEITKLATKYYFYFITNVCNFGIHILCGTRDIIKRNTTLQCSRFSSTEMNDNRSNDIRPAIISKGSSINQK